MTGISSTPDSRAQVILDGQVDEYGLTKIGGEISIFDPTAYTDINMLFRNLEMNSMTPYSGKFVGRRIDSGKLSLDLQYRINDSQLIGEKQIVVDNLTLGERVESADAVNLPLNLSIAVLEDEDGEDPGPLNYGDPDVQKRLESLYVERFDSEVLDVFKTSLREPEKAKDKQKEATPSSSSKRGQDPGLVSKALYAALIDTEPLEESILVELADTRSQAIIFEMVRKGKLTPDRITTQASQALKPGEATVAKLELTAD